MTTVAAHDPSLDTPSGRTVTGVGQAARRATQNLRRVLAVNAATSMATGIAGLVAASWWADTLDVASVGWVQLISAGLIVFGVDVGLVAARATRSLRSAALAVSVADLCWVAATAVVLATVDLTTTGRVLAVVVAADVVTFAVLQLRFRSRLS